MHECLLSSSVKTSEEKLAKRIWSPLSNNTQRISDILPVIIYTALQWNKLDPTNTVILVIPSINLKI